MILCCLVKDQRGVPGQSSTCTVKKKSTDLKTAAVLIGSSVISEITIVNYFKNTFIYCTVFMKFTTQVESYADIRNKQTQKNKMEGRKCFI